MINQSSIYTSGNTASIWQQDTQPIELGALQKSFNTDVCIVGAGIAGLTAAYLFSQTGASVTVLEASYIGNGETARSTAHLSNAFDDHYQLIEKLHGLAGIQAVAQSHSQAIDWIEKIVTKEQMNCGFERLDGYLWDSSGQAAQFLEQELAAAHRAGLKDVEWIDHMPMASLHTSPGLRFPNQAQINPLQYLLQLTKAVIKQGGQIFDQTRVMQVQGGIPGLVTTDASHQIHAQHIIVATNTPINDTLAIHDKQTSNRTYVIGARVPKGAITKALYWDTADPYHYIRLQSGLSFMQNEAWEGFDILLVGGEDHRVGKTPDHFEPYKQLEAWTRLHFPMIDSVVFQWSGQIQEPVDKLAFIGPDPNQDNVYIVTGDSGNGMTHGTIAGLLIKDLIEKKENTWAPYYNPSRIPKQLNTVKEFVSHNLESIKEYKEYITPGDVKSTDEIKPDSGAVIRQGLHKIAAYRDATGQLHQYSAVCKHLKCIVAWNPTEKSWDCPCHGSRYDRFGKLINGPSTEDLTPTE